MTVNKKATSFIDKKIDDLTPGGSVLISEDGNTKVVAERSGDGKYLTIFREYPSGFETIKKTTF